MIFFFSWKVSNEWESAISIFSQCPRSHEGARTRLNAWTSSHNQNDLTSWFSRRRIPSDTKKIVLAIFILNLQNSPVCQHHFLYLLNGDKLFKKKQIELVIFNWLAIFRNHVAGAKVGLVKRWLKIFLEQSFLGHCWFGVRGGFPTHSIPLLW